jgi:hypothetical protein
MPFMFMTRQNPQDRRSTAKKEFLTLGFEEERSAIDVVRKELSL